MSEAKSYACRVCGYHPRSRADWCDAGCGSDYNKMYEIPESVVRKLAAREKRMREVAEEIREAHGRHLDQQFAAQLFYRDAPKWAAKLLEGQDAT